MASFCCISREPRDDAELLPERAVVARDPVVERAALLLPEAPLVREAVARLLPAAVPRDAVAAERERPVDAAPRVAVLRDAAVPREPLVPRDAPLPDVRDAVLRDAVVLRERDAPLPLAFVESLRPAELRLAVDPPVVLRDDAVPRAAADDFRAAVPPPLVLRAVVLRLPADDERPPAARVLLPLVDAERVAPPRPLVPRAALLPLLLLPPRLPLVAALPRPPVVDPEVFLAGILILLREWGSQRMPAAETGVAISLAIVFAAS